MVVAYGGQVPIPASGIELAFRKSTSGREPNAVRKSKSVLAGSLVVVLVVGVLAMFRDRIATPGARIGPPAVAASSVNMDALPSIGQRACTRYVAPNGNDANSGKTLAAAWKTLNGQSGAALSNQVVCFRSGTYALSGQPYGFNGILADRGRITNLVLRAFACEVPVFDGQKNSLLPFLFPGRGSSNITVSRLNFRDIPVASSGVVVTDNVLGGPVDGMTIEDSTFTNIGTDNQGHAIYLGGGTGTDDAGRTRNWVIRRNVFTSIRGGGVHSFHANGAVNVTIEDNVFANSEWGVLISREGQKRWRVDHNVFYDNRGGGLALTYYSESPGSISPISGITIANNIGSASGDIGPFRVDQSIIADAYSQSISESSNTWYRSSGSPLWFGGGDPPTRHISMSKYAEETGQGAGNTDSDPKFRDAGAGDFRLNDDSPALGRGPRFTQFPPCSEPVPASAPNATPTVPGSGIDANGAPVVAGVALAPVAAGCSRIEAEDFMARGGSLQTFYPGASNGKYVSNADAGDAIDWTQPIAVTGAWTFTLRSATAEAASRSFVANGKGVTMLKIAPKGWGVWQSVTWQRTLTKGTYRFSLVTGAGYAQLDYVDVCPPKPKTSTATKKK